MRCLSNGNPYTSYNKVSVATEVPCSCHTLWDYVSPFLTHKEIAHLDIWVRRYHTIVQAWDKIGESFASNLNGLGTLDYFSHVITKTDLSIKSGDMSHNKHIIWKARRGGCSKIIFQSSIDLASSGKEANVQLQRGKENAVKSSFYTGILFNRLSTLSW